MDVMEDFKIKQFEPKLIKQWVTMAGYMAAIYQTRMGTYCGYVGVTATHPLYGHHYGEKLRCLAPLWEKAKGGKVGGRGIIPLVLDSMKPNGPRQSMDVVFDVHGSVTYTDGGPGSDYPIESDLWWVGFDCAHAGDYNPMMASFPSPFRDSDDHHWTVEEVALECEKLAQQIAQVKPNFHDRVLYFTGFKEVKQRVLNFIKPVTRPLGRKWTFYKLRRATKHLKRYTEKMRDKNGSE